MASRLRKRYYNVPESRAPEEVYDAPKQALSSAGTATTLATQQSVTLTRTISVESLKTQFESDSEEDNSEHTQDRDRARLIEEPKTKCPKDGPTLDSEDARLDYRMWFNSLSDLDQMNLKRSIEAMKWKKTNPRNSLKFKKYGCKVLFTANELMQHNIAYPFSPPASRWKLTVLFIVSTLLLVGVTVGIVILSGIDHSKQKSPTSLIKRLQTVTVTVKATNFSSSSNEWIMQGFIGNVSATLKLCLQPINWLAFLPTISVFFGWDRNHYFFRDDKIWPKDNNCHFGQVDHPIIVDCVPGSPTRNQFLQQNESIKIRIRDTPSYDGFVLLATLVNDKFADYTIKGYSWNQPLRCGNNIRFEWAPPGDVYNNRITTEIAVTCVNRVLEKFAVLGGLNDKMRNHKIDMYSFDASTNTPSFPHSIVLPEQLLPSAIYTPINEHMLLISGGCKRYYVGCSDRSERVYIANLADDTDFDQFNSSITPIASFEWPVSDHFVFVAGRFLIVCGGERENNKLGLEETINMCYKLDMGASKELLHNSTWVFWKNMTRTRNSLSGVNMNGELFVIGGQDDDNNLLKSVEYIGPDFNDNKWSIQTGSKDSPYPDQTFMNTAVLSNNRFIMCGGNTTTKQPSKQCSTLYTSAKKQTFEKWGRDLNEARSQGGLLHTGRGLLAFGGGTNTFEYYHEDDKYANWTLIKGVHMKDSPRKFGVVAWYKDDYNN